MLIISHRGNINGPNPKFENSLTYIISALDIGFNVEIDLWCKNGLLYLGHDEPQYLLNKNNEKILEDHRVWVHAKNLDACDYLLENKKVHFFFHNNDPCTLTSRNIIWMFPKKGSYKKAIFVLPELADDIKIDSKNLYGVCTDYPLDYKNFYD